MLKNWLAIYGAMRMLDDLNQRQVKPPQNEDNSGCGCLLVLVLIFVIWLMIKGCS